MKQDEFNKWAKKKGIDLNSADLMHDEHDTFVGWAAHIGRKLNSRNLDPSRREFNRLLKGGHWAGSLQSLSYLQIRRLIQRKPELNSPSALRGFLLGGSPENIAKSLKGEDLSIGITSVNNWRALVGLYTTSPAAAVSPKSIKNAVQILESAIQKARCARFGLSDDLHEIRRILKGGSPSQYQAQAESRQYSKVVERWRKATN